MSPFLPGKVALVTGGSRGIGAAIARRLAAHGAAVALSYSASPDRAAEMVATIEQAGGRAVAIRADQADPAAAAELIETAHAKFGRSDILVNNAGVTVQGRIDDPAADQAALERQFAINVTSVAAAVRRAAPLLADGGRIISIGSVFGARSPWQGIGGYSATKAALGGYTRGWARDLGPPRHHRQPRAARRHQHRAEPRNGGSCGGTGRDDGTRPLRSARRDRSRGRVPRGPRCELRHGCDDRRRRRSSRLKRRAARGTMPAPPRRSQLSRELRKHVEDRLGGELFEHPHRLRLMAA